MIVAGVVVQPVAACNAFISSKQQVVVPTALHELPANVLETAAEDGLNAWAFVTYAGDSNGI